MAGPDLSVLVTLATDYSEEIGAILAVFISLAIYYVVLKANQIILRVLGRNSWD